MYLRASKALWRGDFPCTLPERDGDRVARNKDGSPRVGLPLDEMIKWKKTKLCDAVGYPPLLPLSTTIDWRRHGTRLGIWSRCDRDLSAWSRPFGAADVAEFVATCKSDIASALFDVQPLTNSCRPNLEVVRDLGVPVFCPHEGHVLVVAQLPQLKLRCLATLCRHWYGGAAAWLYSAFVFRQSDDPIHVVADRLRHRHRYDVDTATEESEVLRRCQLDEDLGWHTLTRAMLEVLPLGLPFELAKTILDSEYGLDRLSRKEWEGLSKVLLRDIVLELRRFLDYDPGQAIAENRGKLAQEVRHEIGLEFWLNVHNRPRHDPAPSKAWKELGGGRHGRDDLGDSQDLKTLREGVGGRVSSRWYPAEIHRQAWGFLIDDTLKLAGYALVARGFRLLAVVGEELLLEVPAHQVDRVIQEVRSTCDQAARELLRGAAPAWRAPEHQRWPALSDVRKPSETPDPV